MKTFFKEMLKVMLIFTVKKFKVDFKEVKSFGLSFVYYDFIKGELIITTIRF